MVLPKVNNFQVINSDLTPSKKRRNRRKKLQTAQIANIEINAEPKTKTCSTQTTAVINYTSESIVDVNKPNILESVDVTQGLSSNKHKNNKLSTEIEMSSKEAPSNSREDVLAAREAKKLAKQKFKNKEHMQSDVLNDTGDIQTIERQNVANMENTQKVHHQPIAKKIDMSKAEMKGASFKSKDEVDRVALSSSTVLEDKIGLQGKSKEEIMCERAAKKAAKQQKKKGVADHGEIIANQDLTVKDVVDTLKDIKNVAREMQDITEKVSAINFKVKEVLEISKPEDSKRSKADVKTEMHAKQAVVEQKAKAKTDEDTGKQPEELGKSKAELRAERRAKQEAQRAAKQASVEQKAIKSEPVKVKPETQTPAKSDTDVVKEKSPKPKSKPVSGANRVNWFHHLNTGQDKEAMKRSLNSNLHPAIIKLGVQLESRVVSGSNARCIALLDALKKMIRDYTLPAKTEFGRGLESHLAATLEYLWAMRPPSASQTNAVKWFRHYLTQLPNDVDEFDAKKTLQEEIDKYIEDQIDKAGEAISMAVRNKISTGDNILTYGCSSLIERILREAWAAKVDFRTVIVGNRVHGQAREMLRRLAACGLPCTYVDITAISFVMKTINKVLLGASSLLVNGSVLGAAGTAQVALAARARNVPVLVACETHKFSERVQTDAFVYNELGDPDDLIDKSDENSPLKDWRSNPNLTPLNLTYDVTPPSLVTAVVTEKAILPCTSAPVVLRTKLSEFGI